MDLSSSMKSSLSSSKTPNPILDQMYPKVRSKLLNILSRRLSEPVNSPNGEDLIVNAIVMEYLHWIGYRHTAEMMKKETKLLSDFSSEALSLCQLRSKLDTSSACVDDEPLIFSLLWQTKK